MRYLSLMDLLHSEELEDPFERNGLCTGDETCESKRQFLVSLEILGVVEKMPWYQTLACFGCVLSFLRCKSCIQHGIQSLVACQAFYYTIAILFIYLTKNGQVIAGELQTDSWF
jgi:hypothetical protein